MKSISNREFLAAAFKHMRSGEFAAVASFPGDPLTVPHYAWAARPWQHGTAAPGTIFGRKQNAYIAVSSFRPDAAGTFHRRKDDFGQMHVVMVDDIYEKVSRRKLKLPPSAMVQTSPPSAQAFYFLKPTFDTRDRGKCEQLVDAMIRSGLTTSGADPGMRGVTRYGRLPVGINGKAKHCDKHGQPFQCQLKLWNPERRYSLAEIAKAFRLDLSTARSSRARPGTFTPTATTKLRRGEALRRVKDFEAMLKTLAAVGLYTSARGKWHEIVCPWVDEHTDQEPGGSALYEPAESNTWIGGFKCHHGHCEARTVGDVYRFVHALARGAA